MSYITGKSGEIWIVSPKNPFYPRKFDEKTKRDKYDEANQGY